MGKEEFARQISRQRATSETQSQNSENAESKPMIASPDRSLSRQGKNSLVYFVFLHKLFFK